VNGSGRRRTKSVTENAAVLAPTPSATMTIAVRVKPRERFSVRAVYRRSCFRMSQWTAAAFMIVSCTAPIHSAVVENGPLASRSRRLKMAAISSPYSARKDAG
jgi:hypothetical protein